jgi:hypothetical protein
LAVSLIFGVIASTALTLMVIPLLYYIYLKFAGTKDLLDPEEQKLLKRKTIHACRRSCKSLLGGCHDSAQRRPGVTG